MFFHEKVVFPKTLGRLKNHYSIASRIPPGRPRGILYRFAYCIRDARHHCIPPTNLRKACQKIGEIRPKICQNTSPTPSKWTSLKVSLVSWTVLGIPKSQDESRFRSEARTIIFAALFLTILSENGPEMGVPFFR